MNKNPRSTGGAGQIRIIGGQWRGRKLPVPDSAGLRPTTDRVRETLFNWLAPVLPEARCLDCFAGSGALGLEALSRYAGSATLLELERPVAQQLTKKSADAARHEWHCGSDQCAKLAGTGGYTL
ncbi:Putative methylase [Pantoea vagans C9-1]|nr:Putative methylase [Pantoea vagans C9-1]